MNLDFYGDDSKGIIKLDPRTKLFLFLTSSIVSLNLYGIWGMVVFSGLLCLLLGLCGKRAFAVGAFAVFAAVVFLRTCVEMQGTGAGGFVLVTQALCTLFLFVFPITISLLMLVQTTRISQFLYAFQAMHLPAAFTIPLAVLFRFIPTVQDEWAGIRKAMSFRGIELTFGAVIRNPGTAIEYLLVPLLFSSVSVMEELAAAAEARGLDADCRRSSYEEVHLSAADYIVMALFGAITIYVVASVAMGVA
ncbi:energy-coupling factor transporter transmembrane component T [Xiamenia xianingshaonis]|uniref:Energy-coupling factor transporter transmembrane protein EcfT n=1 Tax=Xiamenia xianingshaonis TaxID=2682776 RepID=A0ABX0IIT1_9ACTN|nr:energy-coupling factor transporter transmembrane component T [Xiamenia xianingshaonis]NGM17453.1 energy-coupling factor transporter transmembrane protein EcfT [Eggerthellaceae bacterium zg-893]NHM14752.1 energy-coupling factor transporter transmembrane protein EcfT [Xiamenia xianingshaonis]